MQKHRNTVFLLILIVFLFGTPPKRAHVLQTTALSSNTSNTLQSTYAHAHVKGAGTDHFVHISSRDPHYFEFDDGTPFFPIGINNGWILSSGSNRGDGYEGSGDPIHSGWTAERYFQEMAAHNMNYVRIWMCSWHIYIEPTLGVYSESAATQLDNILVLAEEYDIYLQLVMLTFTDFSKLHGNQWDNNPYNSANGGPCDLPVDFLTNETAKYYIKKRFNYILDRWGDNPRIAVWEFWNEVDLVGRNVDPYVPPTDAISKAWHEDVAQVFRENDTHSRPLTTSCAGDVFWDQTFESDAIDVIQIHTYSTNDENNIAETVGTYIKNYLDYGKPVMIGEYGSIMKPQIEPEHCSNGLWAAMASGSGGTALRWASNIGDDVGDMTDAMFDRYLFFARFFEGVSWPDLNIGPGTGSISGSLLTRVFSLQGDGFAFAWVQRTVTRGTVTGAKLSFSGLANDDYTVYVYDDSTGIYLSWENETVTSGGLTIELSDFTTHLAVKVIPAESAHPVSMLVVSPRSLSFRTYPGSSQTSTIAISEVGGVMNIQDVTLSVVRSDWVALNNTSFEVQVGISVGVGVTLNVPQGVKPGVYDALARIHVETKNAGNLDIPVNIHVVRFVPWLPVALMTLLAGSVIATGVTIFLLKKRKKKP